METLCRLCMSIDAVGMEPIFRSVMGNCLAAKVVSVTQLTMYEGDGLPANICQQCIFKLDVSDAFIQKCKLSDIALRAMQAVQKDFKTPPTNDENSRNWRCVTDPRVDPMSSNANREMGVVRFRQNVDNQKDHNKVLANNMIDIVKIEDTDHEVSSGSDEIGNSYQTSGNPMSKDSMNSRIQESKQKERSLEPDHASKPASKDKDGDSSSLHTEIEKEVSTTSLQPSNNCDICQREFSSKHSLARHVKRIHRKRPHAKKPRKNSKVTNALKADRDILGKFVIANATKPQSLTEMRKPRALSKFSCTMCKRTFASQMSLNKHCLVHSANRTIFSCKLCPMMFGRIETLNKHMLVTHSSFQCDVCQMRFRTEKTLADHILLHSKERPHECLQCSKRFMTAFSLSTHMLVHSDERPYECPNCPQKFKRSEHLSRHMKRFDAGQCVHKKRSRKKLPKQSKNVTGQVSAASDQNTSGHPRLDNPKLDHDVIPEKSLSCWVCGENFSSLTDHKCHMEAHKGHDEKLYSCKVCGLTFSSRPGLESHMPSHNVSREFLFPCKVCGRRFTSEASVSLHMSIHVRAARHKCPKCTRCFQTSFALKEHTKFHEEGAQFTCSLCSENFFGQEALQCHLLTHAAEQYVDHGNHGEPLNSQPPQSQ